MTVDNGDAVEIVLGVATGVTLKLVIGDQSEGEEE